MSYRQAPFCKMQTALRINHKLVPKQHVLTAPSASSSPASPISFRLSQPHAFQLLLLRDDEHGPRAGEASLGRRACRPRELPRTGAGLRHQNAQRSGCIQDPVSRLCVQEILRQVLLVSTARCKLFDAPGQSEGQPRAGRQSGASKTSCGSGESRGAKRKEEGGCAEVVGWIQRRQV